jgi:crotonobetainyl-CoA:carnitine CoA-transferase CaiB-like acyl-CoA transferase
MFEGLLSIVLGEHMAGKLFRPPVGSAGYQRSLTPNRRLYKTTDGYICVLIHTDKHWRKFFEAIGRQDLFQTDQRFSRGATGLQTSMPSMIERNPCHPRQG